MCMLYVLWYLIQLTICNKVTVESRYSRPTKQLIISTANKQQTVMNRTMTQTTKI